MQQTQLDRVSPSPVTGAFELVLSFDLMAVLSATSDLARCGCSGRMIVEAR